MTLSRTIQDFVRREIAKALAQAGFVGGTLDAGRLGGSLPEQPHGLWSSTHTDVDASDTPVNGDVITWSAATGKWIASQPAGGGGGGTVYTNSLASPPVSPGDGDVWIPSDSAGLIFFRSGGTWHARGPIFPFTPPNDADFAWINQGSATVDTSKGGIYLSCPASSTGIHIRKKAAPGTPYTITAAIIPHVHAVDFNSCGLVFRESSSGKISWFRLVHAPTSGGSILQVDKFNSPTSFSAVYTNVPRQDTWPIIWLRIADNGTNRICSWSADGQHFHQVHSVSRTDFLTADEVGFAVDPADPTWPAGMTLLSWKES